MAIFMRFVVVAAPAAEEQDTRELFNPLSSSFVELSVSGGLSVDERGMRPSPLRRMLDRRYPRCEEALALRHPHRQHPFRILNTPFTHNLTSVVAWCLAWGVAATTPNPAQAATSTSACFAIQVVDEATGRGVPLVELKTVHHAAWWTDSAGLVAFDEPGLMGQEVFFHVASPGYEYAKDFFEHRGVKLHPQPGERAQIKLKRINIAERLYRVTGAGIYRDSALLGAPLPLKQPVFNAQVVGQDTVIATPYRGKIYWFWGDTERASYPLGNFNASGATSELPAAGGLDPGVGVDLKYFTDDTGFSKGMCPDMGEGLKWIEGLLTLPDQDGRERLLAHVAVMENLRRAHAWHLAMFNDDKQVFESLVRWDIHEPHDSAHPFRARVNGVDYFYLYPSFRVRAELAALRDLKNYEAFTCIAGDGKLRGEQPEMERDGDGHARYTWKAGADRWHSGQLRNLLRRGGLKATESWLQLRDVDTGTSIEPGRGSVFWNQYRQRWIMITSGKPGEVWFSEGDAPTGPWVYARRVAHHGRYNFYNPTQHPFFDQDGGRVIYFEGTYTDSFTDAPVKTPRYEYNQLMYRLTLDDPRLALPVPVYRMKAGKSSLYLLRETIAAEGLWEQVEGVAFCAIPPSRRGSGLVPVYATADGKSLQREAPTPQAPALFLALPIAASAASAMVAPLRELVGKNGNDTDCQVWKNPASNLTFDFGAAAVIPAH